MNDSDLESKLSRQPMRRVPEDWRAGILADASEAILESSLPTGIIGRQSLFAALIQTIRLRPAWAGIAAMWVMTAFFQVASPQVTDQRQTMAGNSRPLSPQIVIEAWKLRFAELGPDKTLPALRPPVGRKQEPADRPRSFLFGQRAMA